MLEFNLWKEPLEDPSIRVFVAIHDGKVVGSTEYRYYPQWNITMTDFTIIGKTGLGIGRFLAEKREEDSKQLAAENDTVLFGMFAEIYNPQAREDFPFGNVYAMNPYVRREVLSHLGYKRLDFSYVHPSWKNDGEAVEGLDFCFMPMDEETNAVQSTLIVDFLTDYYSVLSNKPDKWLKMIDMLKQKDIVKLLPL